MQVLHLPDYTKLVIAAFVKLQKSDEVSSFLKKPTPSSIRNECLRIYESDTRAEQRDQKAIDGFFGQPRGGKTFTDHIKKFPTDKFRQVKKLMDGTLIKSDLVYVELLAWIVDFRHRRYDGSRKVELNEEEINILQPLESKTSLNDPPATVASQPVVSLTRDKEPDQTGDKPTAVFTSTSFWSRFKRKNVAVAAFLVLMVCLSGPFVRGTFDTTTHTTPSENVSEWPGSLGSKSPGMDNPNGIIETRHRCQAITKKGTQCKRSAGDGTYCWQHDGKS